MDQFFTVVVLLGLTLGLAAGLRKQAGTNAISVNWDGPPPQTPRPAAPFALARRGLTILPILVALGLALLLAGSHASAHTSGPAAAAPVPQACVNWNGNESGGNGTVACVNWNGNESGGNGTVACVNWNGPQGGAPTVACVNWNGSESGGNGTVACVNWNGHESGGDSNGG